MTVKEDDDPTATLRTIRRHMSPALALLLGMNGKNRVESSADGAQVQLSDGSSMLDFGSYGIGILGHRHPDVVAAVTAQLGRMPAATRALPSEVHARFAKELVAYVGVTDLTRVWTGLNGADVVEAALKLARVATGRTRIVAIEGGFHGKSHGALAVTASPRYRRALQALLPPVTHLPHDVGDDALDTAFAGGDVAAVIVEPVQGEGGVHPLSAALLHALRRHATDNGAFLIADEIQCGLRRCGPRSVSLDLGVVPDAILLGKSLGGGVMPLSAMVANSALYAPLLADPFLHTTTFAGHPLSAAAGIAALRAIERHAPDGARVAARLGNGLKGVLQTWPNLIAAIRGQGLLHGVEFRSVDAAGLVLAELGPRGLLVSPCLGEPQVIRLFAPMIVTDDQVDRVLRIFGECCAIAADAGTVSKAVPAAGASR